MFWMIVIWIVATVVQLAVSLALRPKIQKRGPGELQAPICEQGHPIAYVAGCAKIRGVNVVWKGQVRTKGKHDDQIFDYWVRLHLIVCHGVVDRIRRIWFGQDSVPTTKVLAERGSAFQPIKNAFNLSSVTTYNVAPSNPTSNMIVMVGASPEITGWGYDANSLRPINQVDEPDDVDVPPANCFAKRSSVTFTIVRPFYQKVTIYYWTFVKPSVGDLIFRDGVYSRFDGAAWAPEDTPEVTEKQSFSVSIDNKEQSISVGGRIAWYDGDPNQAPDPMLKKWARGGGDTPNYAGICHVVMDGDDINGERGFYWGQSPAIPEVSFEVERIPDPLGLGAKAVPCTTTAPCIDGGSNLCRDANPANVLYELLIDPTIGLGMSAADIDAASFRDAGRVLYEEKIGITIVLDTQMSFDDAAKEIVMVADGMLFEDPKSGLWTFRLVREPLTSAQATAYGLETDFYSRTDWLVFDEDDFIGTDPEYARSAAGDVANKIVVQFICRDEGYAQRVVDVQNVASFLDNNEFVSIQNTYNAANSYDLATRLGIRDMKTAGYPRARIIDELNRKGTALRPCDCFIVNRPTLGISNMRFRVTGIAYGTMRDGRVRIEAVEDVFGMPATVYSTPGSGWIDPSTIPPVPPTEIRAWELAYDVTRDGPRVGFAALIARGDPNTTGAVLWSTAGGTLEKIGPVSYTPTGVLTTGLVIEETTATIQLQGAVDMDEFFAEGVARGGGNLALVDDELIAFDSIGRNLDGTVYLSGCLRGVLDTIPRAHLLGARVWMIRRPSVVMPEKTTLNHSEIFAIQATGPGGETDILGEDFYGGSTESRELRPFVPGKFRVGSATDLAPSLVDRVQVGDLPVSWKSRNRLSVAPGLVAQGDDTIAPEAGQTNRVSVVQGADRMFVLVGPAGGSLLFGTAIAIGSATPWAIVQGSTCYLANGVGMYADTPLASPAAGTWYVGVDLSTYSIAQVQTRPAAWIDLYSVVVAGSGAGKTATVTDLRTRSVLRTTDTGAESDAVLISDMAGPASALLPFRMEVTAVRDGLESMESRETGELFAAGVGLNMGNLFV